MDLHLLCTYNGVTEDTLSQLAHEDWVGIDYGTVVLLRHGITPIAAFGDFDSTTPAERDLINDHIEVEVLPSEKNETDLEVGIHYALTLDYDRVFIHGATGGRMDHFLGNLQTLAHPDVILSGSEFYIVDDQNIIQVLAAGTHIITHAQDMQYVSFIPLGEQVLLTIEGLKYELPRTPLELGRTRTVSNEFIADRAQVTVENGMVYMVQSRDKSA
ncbi:thiamine diphosphokinase [Macrococcus equipercicus]|uniref:Thiamine diphosphokinase n=1 Tax=Macrococcus equipercicus TaxID=69967 RepID=A0ABQ6RBZ6_9STAP|nr:thiamine diphosphokinase [Macrococcus equipercicus]KAA1042759.1 thiamine diphosphokinase [Macrococcus equipercicus]